MIFVFKLRIYASNGKMEFFLTNASRFKLEINLLKLTICEITSSSLGIDELTIAWLRIIKKLNNSNPLFLKAYFHVCKMFFCFNLKPVFVLEMFKFLS